MPAAAMAAATREMLRIEMATEPSVVGLATFIGILDSTHRFGGGKKGESTSGAGAAQKLHGERGRRKIGNISCTSDTTPNIRCVTLTSAASQNAAKTSGGIE